MTSGTPARDGVSNYAGVTATTRQLLQYWSNRDRLSGFSCPESSPFSLTSTTEHGPPDPKPFWLNSEQLEFGDGMSDDFRRIAAREIDEFKAEYRDRYPERDVEKIADEELLREVMNTVGKSGRRGEQIRCVVPVSMLTEGWDANT